MNSMQKLIHGKHETQWVTISLDEYMSTRSTLEILSDPEAMEQIHKGEKDIAEGRVKSWEHVKKELRL